MSELQDLPSFLRLFAVSPIRAMRGLPPWHWSTFISLQIGIAIISGVLLGLISLSFWNFILGLVVLPISTLLASFVITFFLNYFFAFFTKTYLDLRRLFGVVVVAQIPFLILHILSAHVPPIDLIGFGITCLLLIVGLIEHFQMNRKVVTRLALSIYILFSAIWIGVQITSHFDRQKVKAFETPQTLDAIEAEVKDQ
jgi:hypothetical protein